LDLVALFSSLVVDAAALHHPLAASIASVASTKETFQNFDLLLNKGWGSGKAAFPFAGVFPKICGWGLCCFYVNNIWLFNVQPLTTSCGRKL
jgi:hypothetical protein